VDRVLDMEKGKRITALKNVTMNEPFFNGHFPHRPVMPGVLMLEAMAQAAALLSFKSLDIVPDDNTVYYFAPSTAPASSARSSPATSSRWKSRSNA
jgi:3-hydroxyacyl-[acyl-carrier-protein] dehydratase